MLNDHCQENQKTCLGICSMSIPNETTLLGEVKQPTQVCIQWPSLGKVGKLSWICASWPLLRKLANFPGYLFDQSPPWDTTCRRSQTSCPSMGFMNTLRRNQTAYLGTCSMMTLGRSQTTCPGMFSITTPWRNQTTWLGMCSMNIPSETTLLGEVRQLTQVCVKWWLLGEVGKLCWVCASWLLSGKVGQIFWVHTQWVSPLETTLLGKSDNLPEHLLIDHSQENLDNMFGYVLNDHSWGSQTNCSDHVWWPLLMQLENLLRYGSMTTLEVGQLAQVCAQSVSPRSHHSHEMSDNLPGTGSINLLDETP